MKVNKDSFQNIIDSGASTVCYDKDSLLKSLIEDIKKPKQKWKKPFVFPYRSLWHFVFLCTIAIVVFTLVTTFSLTYIKDILFFKSNLSVNRNGVFMPSKACGREYCLFLFNTSDLWANTGIYLNKGDKYKMSISGAFHSSAGHLNVDSDLNNPSPNVKWIGGELRKDLHERLLQYKTDTAQFNHNMALFNKTHGTIFQFLHKTKPEVPLSNIPQFERIKYCLKKDTYIGAVLYRIAPEFMLQDSANEILVWEPSIGEKYTEVKSSGVLTMAINDIYFKTPTELGQYAKAIKYRFGSAFDTIKIIDKEKSKEDFKRMFYDDNLGQILVCLEIQHPLFWGFFNPLAPFRDLDTALELKAEKAKNRFHLFFKAIPNFICFFFHICILFIIYTLASVIIVYLFFLFGYYIYKTAALFKKKKRNLIVE